MTEWNWSIPSHWKWETLGEIADWASGGTPKATEPKYYGGHIPWLVIGDLNDGVVTTSAKAISERGLQESSAKYVEPGSILVAMYGSIGKLGIAGIRCTTNQAIAFTRAVHDEVEPKYLFHYLASVRDILLAEGKGGAQANISQTVLKATPFCYPPREEQRCIAKRLDNISARLGDAKVRLDSVPAILKRFRLSVLTAAFSGRLTEYWRRRRQSKDDLAKVIESVKQRNLRCAKTLKEQAAIQQRYAYVEGNDNENLPDKWRFIALDKLATFTYGTSAKSQNAGKVPVLRMGNVQCGEIDWQDLVFTSNQVEISKYALKPLTVLFNRTNSPELVGKTAIYRGERPAIFAGYLIRINAEPELLSEYLNYCLNSPAAKTWAGQVKTDGVSQSNINAQKLGKYEIPFCSLEEQTEIVRRVKAMFKQADAIEAQHRKAHAFTDKLMSSVRAKAFRGELIQTGNNSQTTN